MQLSSLAQLGIIILLLTSGCGSTKSLNIQDDEYVPAQPAAINLQLGVAYMNRGDNPTAMTRLKKAIRYDPNYADAHNAIAILYERLGQDAQAGEHYEIAALLKPNDSSIHNNYGQYLCKKGFAEQAEQHFLLAISDPLYQQPEIPYTNAGMCAVRNNQLDKAEDYFHKALSRNPNLTNALFQMANVAYEKKHYQEARDYLARYVAIAKHNAQTLWLGIRIERALNNKDTEASYAILLRSQFPDSEETQSLNRLENHD